MNAAEFDDILTRRLDMTWRVLASKAGEYASEADRLHNFKRAGELRGNDQGEALLGMLVNHWVSIQDMVLLVTLGHAANPAVVDEKVGDAVNCLILLEAVLKERP